jgi:hypothetical protein
MLLQISSLPSCDCHCDKLPSLSIHLMWMVSYLCGGPQNVARVQCVGSLSLREIPVEGILRLYTSHHDHGLLYVETSRGMYHDHGHSLELPKLIQLYA